MMDIKPIRTEKDYQTALEIVEELWDAEQGTPEGDKLDILTTLIEDYEDRYFPIEAPSPVEAIRFRMDQLGLKPKDLEPFVGYKGRVSEILNERRPLTLRMIRKLSKGLNIPVSILVQEQRLQKASSN